jgi:multidrug efflux pump subunit AcrB
VSGGAGGGTHGPAPGGGGLNFVTWAIRNPVPVAMLFVILTVAGLFAFRRLDIQDRPDIAFPYITVSMSYAGTPPDQLETEITRKIEDTLANVVGVTHITSNVSLGSSITTVEFDIGTDLSQAVDDVRDAVTRVRSSLPGDALEPVISRATTSGNAILTYSVSNPSLSDEELSWFVDQTVLRKINVVPGVGRVARIGGVDREIRVNLDPDRMAALGATASDVSRQLKRIQADLPAGTARVGGLEQNVRAIGTISSANELAALPIVLSDGRSVQLSAIATVADQSAEQRQLAMLDGKPVVAFSVTRAWGAGVEAVARKTEAAIKELEQQYPQVRFTVIDDSEVLNVRESYRSSMEMLVEGALLAILVVWIFLRDWRATLISASALPLAVIPTFLGMALLGYTLNLLTLLALTLVVGMLVDDAIVEVENIVRHLRMGKPPLAAATDAAIEIGLAVVATSLTLCAVFVPVAFMGGISGEFFRPFAFTSALAVLCSLLVARLLTPAMAAYWMRPHEGVEREPAFLGRYLRAIDWCLHHRRVTLLTATALFLGSLALGALVPQGFAPGSDIGASELVLQLPPGSSLAQSQETVRRARERLAGLTDIAHTFAVIGNGSTVNSSSLAIIWKPRKERSGSEQVLQRRAVLAVSEIPGMRVQTRGRSGNTVQFNLVGDDTVALLAASSRVVQELAATPGFSAPQSGASLLQPEIEIRPLPARAAELGVTTEAISTAIRFATSGDVDLGLAKLNLPSRQVPIRVRLDDEARADISRLRLLPVPGRSGAVPLANVAEISMGTAPATISRYDRNRNVSITADLDGIALGDALTRVESLPSMRNLPTGVRRVDTGESLFFSQMVSSFILAMVIGILCVYALLVLLFHDFVQPITILSALPPSVGGAFVALLLAGYQLSISSLIGMLTLMGIVTKNSILLVEYAVMARRDHGLLRHEAILDACRKRARPIIMTTIAMGAGMLPIALGLAGDPSFRSPMGVAVIGGLLASTVLSLFVVPVTYTLLDDIQVWFKKKLGRSGEVASAPTPIPVHDTTV